MAFSNSLTFKSDILEHLKEIFPVEGFQDKDIQRLLRISEIRKYRSGQLIVEEAKSHSYVYYLISGQVKIEKNGNVIGILRYTGDQFGAVGSICGNQSSASVMAIDNCVCVAINIRRLESLAEAESYFFKYIIFRKVARDLCSTLETIMTELVRSNKRFVI